jgi:hypothetical protein
MQCRTEPSCERVIALLAVQVPFWRPVLLLLAHVGYTAAGVRLSQKFALRRPLDYRLVVLMAILPDIIDRFLYVFVIPGAESGHLFAHTLVFNVALFVVLVAIRRELWIYALLPIAHLALDLPVCRLDCPDDVGHLGSAVRVEPTSTAGISRKTLDVRPCAGCSSVGTHVFQEPPSQARRDEERQTGESL